MKLHSILLVIVMVVSVYFDYFDICTCARWWLSYLFIERKLIYICMWNAQSERLSRLIKPIQCLALWTILRCVYVWYWIRNEACRNRIMNLRLKIFKYRRCHGWKYISRKNVLTPHLIFGSHLHSFRYNDPYSMCKKKGDTNVSFVVGRCLPNMANVTQMPALKMMGRVFAIEARPNRT